MWTRTLPPIAALLFLTASGCTPSRPKVVETPPLGVTVSRPLQKDVTDFNEYTGKIEAIETVTLKARVFGYLERVNFVDGQEVKKGDVLFEIDPRTYQAALDQAEAKVKLSETRSALAKAEHARSEKLLRTGAIGREEYDKTLAAMDEAAASVRAARADLERDKLNLGFTKITAPIAGKIGKQLVTPGNLIHGGEANATSLATIVSMDPVYIYFDVDEPAMYRYKKRALEEKRVADATDIREAKIEVKAGLVGEDGYPHKGIIDFVDNRVDPGTGTIKVRAVFPNPTRLLVPGSFARVTVAEGKPYPALLVPERAIGTDLGMKYVLLVNEKDTVVSQPVELGTQHGKLRVVTRGLTKDSRVIVDGMQRARPGSKVAPEEMELEKVLAVDEK
jgi:RND family efflux transporter MFP subunit